MELQEETDMENTMIRVKIDNSKYKKIKLL